MENLRSIKFLQTFPYLSELDSIVDRFQQYKYDGILEYHNVTLIFLPNEIEYFFKKINLLKCNIKNYEYNKVIISDNIEFGKMNFISYKNIFLYFCNDVKEIYNPQKTFKFI